MRKRYSIKLFLICLIISSCVYRPDLQQGNLLKIENIDRIEVGMTKSQIRYLFGRSSNWQPISNRSLGLYLSIPRQNEC